MLLWISLQPDMNPWPRGIRASVLTTTSCIPQLFTPQKISGGVTSCGCGWCSGQHASPARGHGFKTQRRLTFFQNVSSVSIQFKQIFSSPETANCKLTLLSKYIITVYNTLSAIIFLWRHFMLKRGKILPNRLKETLFLILNIKWKCKHLRYKVQTEIFQKPNKLIILSGESTVCVYLENKHTFFQINLKI